MMCLPRQQATHLIHRQGVVLVLVLVIVSVLSFAVYAFTQRSLLEYTAVRASLDHTQRRELASSAIEMCDVGVRNTATLTELATGPLQIELPDERIGFLSVVQELPGKRQMAEFGLQDESSKLNINSLDLRKSKRRQSRQRLMALPGMTVQIADAILDWMDADDEVSEFGAESNYYSSLKPPYRPRQGRFADLHELLLVKGITEELLYGEDRNGNGMLDPNEDDGNEGFPRDDNDGLLDRGWIADITLTSREGILLPDGSPKINLNQPNLARLYDDLLPGFGAEMARFVVAFRMRGATWSDEVREAAQPDEEERRLERIESARRRLQRQLRGRTTTSVGDALRDMERDGIRLTSTPGYRFESLVQLFGGKVQITIENEDQFLSSPWRSDPGTLRQLLPLADRLLTTATRTAIEGRVNVNQASEVVLNSIPGVTRTMARSIVQAQPKRGLHNDGDYGSIAWLASRGILPVAELRRIAPYLTVRGDVQGGIALGWLDDGQPVAGIAFLIDASEPDRRLLAHHDLAVLTRTSAGVVSAE
jgi:type II secretory pathway component PulK